MKGTKTLIALVAVLILAGLVYLFYTSLNTLQHEGGYEFTPAPALDNNYNEGDVISGEFTTEAELEAEIQTQESQETQAEQDLDTLEELDF